MPRPYSSVAKNILVVLGKTALVGVVIVGVFAAPGILKVFAEYDKHTRYARRQERQKFYKAIHHLRKNRLIIVQEDKNGTYAVQLTEKGKRVVKNFEFENLQIPKAPQWDGVWRIVLFDIPKNRNRARDALRQKLRVLGFLKFQESAWAFPYPCSQEIEFIVEFFKVYPYVQIIEAQKVQNDLALRKYFKLL